MWSVQEVLCDSGEHENFASIIPLKIVAFFQNFNNYTFFSTPSNRFRIFSIYKQVEVTAEQKLPGLQRIFPPEVYVLKSVRFALLGTHS